MWEQINALFLRVRSMRRRRRLAGAHALRARARSSKASTSFEGITDATMGHGEGWQYLQAGRFLERAVLDGDAPRCLLREGVRSRPPCRPLDQADWVALLRSCSALEGYCRRYTADVRPERVTEFLLLDAEFPRSIRFCRHAGRGARSARWLATAGGPAAAPSGCRAGCARRSTTARSTRS